MQSKMILNHSRSVSSSLRVGVVLIFLFGVPEVFAQSVSVSSRGWELSKILVDKLLFGLLLAAFGLWISKLLERYKATLAFASEVNRQRLPKIAEVWEKLMRCNIILTLEVVPQLNLKLEGKAYEADMSKTGPKLFKALDELEDIILRNQFWLGRELENDVNSYVQLVRSGFQGTLDKRPLPKDFSHQLFAALKNVEDVQKTILKGVQPELKR
jgi:hypothetical protein